MKKIVLGGSVSLPNIEAVSNAFLKNGFEVEFVDAKFMLAYLEHENKNITFTDTLKPNSIVIPLTEFWISYCIKTGQCLISENALKASRSKRFFYDLITNNKLDSVKYFTNIQDAANFVTHEHKIIIKPEGLNSGLGVTIVGSQNKEKISDLILQASQIKTKNLRLTNVQNNGVLVSEYLDGVEYSADCFYFKGNITIIRVCKKTIAVINDRPCTLIYELIRPTDDIVEKLYSWVNCLFQKTDISFAQFDFIIQENLVSKTSPKIIPIDFACRIGGGLVEFMSQQKVDLYGAAIESCFLGNNNDILKTCKLFTQYNYLPIKKGYIQNDNYDLQDGFSIVFKHKGDYVTSLPSSIGSRIALVIQESKQIIDSKNLLIGDKWIYDSR